MNETRKLGKNWIGEKWRDRKVFFFQPVTGCSRRAKLCIRQMGVHDNTDECSNETDVTPLLYAPLGVLKWGSWQEGQRVISTGSLMVYLVKVLMLISIPHRSFTLYFESVINLLVEVTIQYQRLSLDTFLSH
jgi:hypothetical protein